MQVQNVQWLFPLSALRATPTNYPLEKELYDRARGVEFLLRLGSSLRLLVIFVLPLHMARSSLSLYLPDQHQRCLLQQRGFIGFTCDTRWNTTTVK